MDVDRWSEVLTLVAGVLGLMVVVIAWPRRPPNEHRPGVRQPTVSPPIRVRLDTIGEQARWRVANRHGILDITVDIVTFRPSDSDLAWVSEPIVEPVRISPGRSTTLPTVVDDATLTYDVVVAWTVQHLDGGVQSTRTFTIRPDTHDAVDPVPIVAPSTEWGLAVVYGLVAVLLAAMTSVAMWRLIDGGDAPIAIESTRPIAATTTTVITSTTTVTTVAATSTTAVSVTALPSSTSVSTTTTATSVGAATTTSPARRTTTTTTTTDTTSTTSTVTTTPVPGDLRQVAASGRLDNCSFGTDCLIASFLLVGFPTRGEYVCEFDDGSRFTFRYIGDGADDACARSGSAPSITIEVDGVRSATLTRDSLDGA